MKKQIIQTFKIIILGVLFIAGTSFATQGWVMPGSTTVMPTGSCVESSTNGCNTVNPLDTGNFFQAVSTLGVNVLTVLGDTVVNSGNMGVLSLPPTVALPNPPESDLYVAGRVGVGISLADISSDLDVLGTARVDNLNHSTNTNPVNICADKDGVISLCPSGEYHFIYDDSGMLSHGSLPGVTNLTTLNGVSTYIWQVPDGVFKVHVKVWGGGGGGSAHYWSSSMSGSAGGGGGYSEGDLNVIPGQTWNISVGKGGDKGVNTYSNGALVNDTRPNDVSYASPSPTNGHDGKASEFGGYFLSGGGGGGDYYTFGGDGVHGHGGLGQTQNGSNGATFGGNSTSGAVGNYPFGGASFGSTDTGSPCPIPTGPGAGGNGVYRGGVPVNYQYYGCLNSDGVDGEIVVTFNPN